MELKNVKMIDLLLKLKYREIEENVLITTNNNLTILINYEKVQNFTEVTIQENIPGVTKEYDCNSIHYQCVDGNLIPIFTVVSDEDYIKNRLKVEI